MNNSAPSLNIVTVSEAARIADVSLQTIREWDRVGKLRPVHIASNGWRMYRRVDVDQIVSERTRVLEEKRARVFGTPAPVTVGAS